MIIDEAIEEIQEYVDLFINYGIKPETVDIVSVDALKVAVDVMKDYQRITYENKCLRQENKLAFKELEDYRRIVVERVSLAPLTMNVTITKERAERLGILTKNGQWLNRESTSDSKRCSVCGNSSIQPDRYCGHGGARMDGEQNEL